LVGAAEHAGIERKQEFGRCIAVDEAWKQVDNEKALEIGPVFIHFCGGHPDRDLACIRDPDPYAHGNASPPILQRDMDRIINTLDLLNGKVGHPIDAEERAVVDFQCHQRDRAKSLP
jgi:hypothetical protein